MILLRTTGGSLDSEAMRRVAEAESFDEQSIVYIGPYVGWREAPDVSSQAAEQARQSVTNRFSNRFNITVEALSADEQEEFLRERWTDEEPFDQAPDWYSGNGGG